MAIFGNQKGGVGKSTTSATVAFLLAERGYKVLAFDTQAGFFYVFTSFFCS